MKSSELLLKMDILSSVHHLRQTIDALPALVLRGGGRWVTNCILQFLNEEAVDWKSGQDALEEIRGDKCKCIDDDGFIEQFFRHTHNAKRKRTLKHLKGGSYELEYIKVSSAMTSPLMEGSTFFVINCCCAPSQKGLGTEGKQYNLTLAFRQTEDGWILMPTPYSLCACPVGVLDDCAHRGGAILLLWAIRHCFQDVSYETLVEHLPVNIHALARQLHLVMYMYPAKYTKTFLIDQVIKKETVFKELSTVDADDDDDNDLQLEGTNDQEMQANFFSDEKTVPPIDLRKDVQQWCKEMDVRAEKKGSSNKHDISQSHEACVSAATPNTDSGYIMRKHTRMINMATSVRKAFGYKR